MKGQVHTIIITRREKLSKKPLNRPFERFLKILMTDNNDDDDDDNRRTKPIT